MAYTTIDDPTLYFETKLYTGNSSTNNITGLSFAPDWVWLKERGGTGDHRFFDTVRGATNDLVSNTNDGEADSNTSLTAFNSDGFTLGNEGGVNNNGDTFVSWNWKAGDSNTSVSSSGSGNNAINACTHRANTTAGFSIVKYTGLNSEISNGQKTKVTHGLGVKPDFLIIKNRDSSSNWIVTRGIDNDNHGVLNSTNAFSGSLFTGNQNQSDSTHFVVGNEAAVNANGDEFIAYVFAEKQGYSKFGSYTGNGASSPNEPFVYLGFKPAIIFYKRVSDGTNNWSVFDNKRDPHNEIEKQLNPNISNAEGTSSRGFFLSNGWKVGGGNSGSINNSGSTYIYWAFAESPFVNSKGVPTTAR